MQQGQDMHVKVLSCCSLEHVDSCSLELQGRVLQRCSCMLLCAQAWTCTWLSTVLGRQQLSTHIHTQSTYAEAGMLVCEAGEWTVCAQSTYSETGILVRAQLIPVQQVFWYL